MSFVLNSPDPDVEAAIAYAHARGVIVVAAAGNAGNGDATYPAAYPMVVSVAATDDADQLYPWSSYGSWVTLAAPGCSLTTALGGGFATFCGTSAAAPVVAGLAALGYAGRATSEARARGRRSNGRPSRSRARSSAAGASTRCSSSSSSLP